MITSDRLAAFPSKHGYSPDALRRLLSTHNIPDPVGLEAARAAIRKAVHNAIASWKRTATEQSVPPVTLLRNLVALAAKEDVPVYRVLVESQEVAHWSEDVRCALPAILEQMGPVPNGWRLLHVLLNSERAPRVAELEHAFLLDPTTAFHASLTVAADRITTGSRLASMVARIWSRGTPPPLPLDQITMVAEQVPLPGLKARDLNRLPVLLRAELLASQPARRMLLDPAYEVYLRNNPVANRHTAEAIARRIEKHANKVRTSLARRQMTPAVLEWIQTRGVPASERDRILWAGLDRKVARGTTDSSGLAAAAREDSLDVDLRSAFRFLSRPASKRLERIHHKYYWKCLAPRLSAADWTDALGATASDALRQKAVHVLAEADRIDVLILLGDRAVAGEKGARSAFDAWQREYWMSLPEKVEGSCVKPELTRLLTARSLAWNPDWVARYLEAVRSQRDPLETARIFSGYVRRKSTKRWNPILQSVYRDALFDFAEKSETTALRVLSRGLASADQKGALFQQLVENPLGSENARHGIFAEIMRMQAKLPSAKDAGGQLQSIVRNWEDEWVVELQRLRRERLPVPPALTRFISRGDEQVIRSALSAYPGALIRLALRKLPFRDVLRTAFTDPAIALAVEDSVPRARLRSQIRWVSRQWAKQPSLATAYEVALAFSLRDVGYLRELAWQAGPPSAGEIQGARFDSMYNTYTVPKRTGGTRLITAPSKGLKRLQRRLLDRGFAEVPLHPAATGFLPGGSTLDNARRHVGRAMVVNADIESFFPITGYHHIVRACTQLMGGRLSKRAVLFVADLCSYRSALPTGAPTSPMIGNIVLTPADRAIDKAARRFGIEYTRYADDLTFSGHGECHRILPFVEKVLGGLGYKLKRKKINIFRKGRRQVVTGLVVNEKPNLPRRIRRRLRAAVHQRGHGAQPHWHGRPIRDQELFGRIAVLGPVQPEEALCLRSTLKRAMRAGRAAPTSEAQDA